MTTALRAGRCAVDEPLEDAARAAAEHAASGLRPPARALCDLTLRTTQTARALGLDPISEPALADLGLGVWAGQAVTDVPREQLTAWTSDPSSAPHGGESILDLVDRVRGWLYTAAELPGAHHRHHASGRDPGSVDHRPGCAPGVVLAHQRPPAHGDHAARARPGLDSSTRLPTARPLTAAVVRRGDHFRHRSRVRFSSSLRRARLRGLPGRPSPRAAVRWRGRARTSRTRRCRRGRAGRPRLARRTSSSGCLRRW